MKMHCKMIFSKPQKHICRILHRWMTKHVTDDIKYKVHFLRARPPTHIKLVFTDKTNANGEKHSAARYFKTFCVVIWYGKQYKNRCTDKKAKHERCFYYHYINQSELNLFSSPTFMIIACVAANSCGNWYLHHFKYHSFLEL